MKENVSVLDIGTLWVIRSKFWRPILVDRLVTTTVEVKEFIPAVPLLPYVFSLGPVCISSGDSGLVRSRSKDSGVGSGSVGNSKRTSKLVLIKSFLLRLSPRSKLSVKLRKVGTPTRQCSMADIRGVPSQLVQDYPTNSSRIVMVRLKHSYALMIRVSPFSRGTWKSLTNLLISYIPFVKRSIGLDQLDHAGLPATGCANIWTARFLNLKDEVALLGSSRISSTLLWTTKGRWRIRLPQEDRKALSSWFSPSAILREPINSGYVNSSKPNMKLLSYLLRFSNLFPCQICGMSLVHFHQTKLAIFETHRDRFPSREQPAQEMIRL